MSCVVVLIPRVKTVNVLVKKNNVRKFIFLEIMRSVFALQVSPVHPFPSLSGGVKDGFKPHKHLG